LELYSLADAMKGRPGLNGYAYQADVYCVKCGHQIILSLVDTFPMTWNRFVDSECLPFPIFFGEADTAQHCGGCGVYLYGPTRGGEGRWD